MNTMRDALSTAEGASKARPRRVQGASKARAALITGTLASVGLLATVMGIYVALSRK